VKKLLIVLCCAALSLSVVSCSLTKAPAQAAIKAGEEAVNAVREEAVKYFPDQVAGMDQMITDAKAAFEKGDFKAALAAAKDVPGKVSELTAAIDAKKAELPQLWEGMAAQLPKLVTETKASIAKAKVSKDALASAKTACTGMEADLAKATEAAKSGNLIDAFNTGTAIQNAAAQIKADLGVK
jgi:hypothetical protein